MQTEVAEAVVNKETPAKPWVLIAKFDILEGCEAEFIEIVQQVLDEMRHEKSFISASMCTNPDEQGQFMLFEVWKSREEFASIQVHRDYRKPYEARVQKLLRSPRTYEQWLEARADYAVHVRR